MDPNMKEHDSTGTSGVTPLPATATASAPPRADEGGLRAPPGLTGWRKAWWWFDFIVLVNLARLRFIAVLVVIGAVITQWDVLVGYYDKWTHTRVAEAASSDVEYYCPMHPTVVRDSPKEKCPICSMALSRRKKQSGEVEPLPAGIVNRVQLSPYRVVLAGVKTWPVDFQLLSKEITAVGYVEFDERGQRTVSARVAGRIDQLFANETGEMVSAGDPLASLYSPDLYVTVQNLLDAQHSGNAELQRIARNRLELWGIETDQISEILASGKADSHLTIRSPISGHVIRKYVREGQYVREGTPLYDVADLSTVWIQAQVYEDDMAFLPTEQVHGGRVSAADAPRVTATTRAFPNEPFQGKLAFVYPHVDQDTRTVMVRFELANPGHKLRPGSTATVTLRVSAKDLSIFTARLADPQQHEMLANGRVLAVPETAVIDTGSQQIVYRQTSPGVFEGVQVALGPRMTGPDGATFFPVFDGLTAGERVVASGAFLVDAETRLSPAAGSIYFGASGGKSDAQSASIVRPSTPEDKDAKIEAELAQLSPADRALARQQRFCPVLSDNRLGAMGTPVKLTIEGRVVFVCCTGCKKSALANPTKTLKKAEALQRAKAPDPGDARDQPPSEAEPEKKPPGEAAQADSSADVEAAVAESLAKLADDDRPRARSQRYCAVLNHSRLGVMGPPVKLVIDGQPVFLCCDGCRAKALANPQETLENLARRQAARGTSP
jgi:membrane fusion protein, copper/silver efflux system